MTTFSEVPNYPRRPGKRLTYEEKVALLNIVAPVLLAESDDLMEKGALQKRAVEEIAKYGVRIVGHYMNPTTLKWMS